MYALSVNWGRVYGKYMRAVKGLARQTARETKEEWNNREVDWT